MKRLLIAGAAVAVALALTACGGGGGGGGGGSASDTVSAETIGSSGRVLVDSSGKALYTADQEKMNGALCKGSCLDFWTPLTIPSGNPTAESVNGMLGVARRPDGTRQVTFDGKRLYSFSQDEPGQINGNGLMDAFGGQHFTWHVVSLGGMSGSGQGGNTGNPYNY
jgi:predicted lipoprotein with Yx(FWY)xxD motif